MTEQKGWRGYIFSREIGGSMIPHRVQNLVIRDDAAKKNLLFLLSAVEYAMADCYMILEALLEELNNVDGLIFYSTHMLPPDPLRHDMYRRVLEAGRGIRFALEDLEIKTADDVALIEDLIMCRRLQSHGVSPFALEEKLESKI